MDCVISLDDRPARIVAMTVRTMGTAATRLFADSLGRFSRGGSGVHGGLVGEDKSSGEPEGVSPRSSGNSKLRGLTPSDSPVSECPAPCSKGTGIL